MVSQTIFRALDKMAAGSGLGTRLTTRGTVVRSVTSGPGLLGKGGGTRVL